MKYLCLVYLEPDKFHAVADRECASCGEGLRDSGMLLAAEPLLDAAFLRYETSRLLVTVFAYLLIVAGLFWVAIPYVLRDQINWSAKSVFRWRCLHAIALVYGGVILGFTFTQY